MHDALLRQAVTPILSWPLSSGGRMAGEGAATALLGGAGGTFGSALPEEREQLQGVLESAAAFARTVDTEDAVTGGLWPRWGPTRTFHRYPGLSAADSIRQAREQLWSDVDEAVFRIRQGDDLGARASLGRALIGLGGSFSPAHVKRGKSEDGAWVIRDVFENGPQDLARPGTPEGEPADPRGLAEPAALAAQLLLSYFVHRVLRLASEAAWIRETLESDFLREEAS